MSKGAGNDAGSTSDAELFVDGHAVIVFGFSVAGLCRADFDAIGLFTVVAGHGKIDAYILPLDHFDPGTAWIACPRVEYGAYQLAQATAGTLLLVDDQYFLVHSALLFLDQNVTRERPRVNRLRALKTNSLAFVLLT
jgi:hypothetical protein